MNNKAPYTPPQIAYFLSFPLWVNVACACGVFGGLFGALLLILRKKLALVSYIISLAGLLASNIFHLTSAQSIDLVGGVGGIIFTGFLVLIALFQILYCRCMKDSGVLK